MLTLRPLVLGALLASSARVSAQAPVERVPIPTRTYVAFNPAGLPADVATFEIENAIASGITVGGVASYIDVDKHRFTTFDFKMRYYPGEVVLRDWSIGGSVGFTRFSDVVSGVRQSLDAPTIGILVDRNWVYGREGHFVIGTGVGAKRVIASSADRARADVQRAIVTGRLIIGFAF